MAASLRPSFHQASAHQDAAKLLDEVKLLLTAISNNYSEGNKAIFSDGYELPNYVTLRLYTLDLPPADEIDDNEDYESTIFCVDCFVNADGILAVSFENDDTCLFNATERSECLKFIADHTLTGLEMKDHAILQTAIQQKLTF